MDQLRTPDGPGLSPLKPSPDIGPACLSGRGGRETPVLQEEQAPPGRCATSFLRWTGVKRFGAACADGDVFGKHGRSL